jgi:hypothetical protein
LTRHITEDDCLDLLHGLLNEKQRDAALEHLGTCATCEQMFARHAAHEERVRARGNLTVRPDGSVVTEPRSAAGSPAETRGQTRVFPIRRYFRVAAVAAAAAAVILMFVLPGTLQPPDTPELHSLPAPGEQIYLRSDPGTDTGDALQSGIDAYTSGELQLTVELLGGATASGQKENLRRIYLGSALARLGDFEAAVGTLEPVPFHTVPDPWAGEGRWTLYVAYAATGQASEAEALLIELSREPGAFGDRAREALGK